MSAVNEWVVREYFESLGFLSTQPHKHAAVGKRRREEEETELLFVNPAARTHRLPAGLVLTAEDLRSVKRAIVSVRGWHSERMYATNFARHPELLHFAGPASAQAALERLGPGPLARILCLPRLPASDDLREKLLALLRARGVDGVLTFASILSELLDAVAVNVNYEKSDVLQLLRMLKCYGLVNTGQLELFPPARRPRAATAGARRAPAAEAPPAADQSQSV